MEKRSRLIKQDIMCQNMYNFFYGNGDTAVKNFTVEGNVLTPAVRLEKQYMN